MPSFSFPAGGCLFLLAGIFQGGRDIRLSIARAGQGARRALVPAGQEVKGPARSLPDSAHGSSICSYFLRMSETLGR